MQKSRLPYQYAHQHLSMVLRLVVLITLILLQRSLTGQYSQNSILADGSIYKIATTDDAIYRLDYTYLRDQLGINVDAIDPRNIQIYGNGGGLLSENLDGSAIDDLQENRIFISGQEDGSFDPSDFILLYGQSPDQKIWNPISQSFTRPKHIYADEVHYFIKIGNTPGLRINSPSPLENPTYQSSEFDDFRRIEDEKVNLLDDFNSASGTGQSWFGDLFKGLRTRSYTINADHLVSGTTGQFKMVFAARSGITSTVNANVEGQPFSKLIGSVNLTDVEGRYARLATIEETFTTQDEVLNFEINYPQNSTNNFGWLDYIDVNFRSSLIQTGFPFSDSQSLMHEISAFQLPNQSIEETEIWDITDPLNPTVIAASNAGGNLEFVYQSDTLKTFIAFNDTDQLTPRAVGQIENQNLHGITDVDMAIIYHSSMIDAAELLSAHRSGISGLNVELVDVDEIYNEFGSGAPSPVALRNFAKMLYDRSTSFQYLLLLGDASFDYKNIKQLATSSNLVPTYETKESLDPIRGFPSDDFFALLSDGEGTSLKGALDIAVGRLPAKDANEALDMVNKIIDYESNNERLGEWVNQVTFIADDEDFNIHLNQADQIAQQLTQAHPVYNVEKIYLDAFKQVSTAGGQLYPEVQQAINNSISRGTHVINYMGHGGATGLAQERILTISDVNNWNNGNKLALFVTATCSFASYDDPNFVSAGERAILNRNGGAIALFTTVRAVYSSSNERLTRAVFDNLFEPVNGSIPPIGEILRLSKNSNAADTLGINARKFLLIGDPSLHLIKPSYDAVTTHINDQEVGADPLDTLKALAPVVIAGQIQQNGSLVSSFNGEVDITIFDKPRSVNTLGQDVSSFTKSFETQKNIIFKGKASVVEGTFSFSFIVPKDIDYQLGKGKISYYAQDVQNRDASGQFNEIVVGGTSEDPIVDDLGPEIELFMNDENFVSGGITSPNPTLLVNLKDDNGINIVGNGIGHDITAVIDNATSNTIILNEFYKSELNSTKAGTIRFQLSDIPIGPHTVAVKAWDIANNSTTASLDFVVASDVQSAINRILNYPNPVTDQTSFLIDHNISGGLLDITIDIYALDGKLVQSLKYSSGSGGGLIDNLPWNATNSSGTPLSNGIYLFKVSIKDSNDRTNETIESRLNKLIILK